MKTTLLLFCLAVVALEVRAEPVSDRSLEEAVRSSYNYRSLFSDTVQVHATDGVVTLTGAVPDPAQKALAEETAAGVSGVTRTDDQLRVAAPAEHSDEALAARVRVALLLRPDVSAARARVAVHDGVVTLSGKAGTFLQRSLASALAKAIEGVKDVKNELVVPDEVPKDTPATEPIDDASVAALVKFALRTRQSTSALPVQVEVHSGKVSIRGEVHSDLVKEFVSVVLRDLRGVKELHNELSAG